MVSRGGHPGLNDDIGGLNECMIRKTLAITLSGNHEVRM